MANKECGKDCKCSCTCSGKECICTIECCGKTYTCKCKKQGFFSRLFKKNK